MVTVARGLAKSVEGNERMSSPSKIVESVWTRLLDDAGVLIQQAWERTNGEKMLATDPKTISVLLFQRFRNHRNAFALLYKAHLTTEAEIMLRSGIEVAICLSNLRARPEAFLADLNSDAAKTLSAQVPLIFEGREADGEAKELSEFFGPTKPDGKKHTYLEWAQLASDGGVADLYDWYKLHSGRSVHVTGISISQDASSDDEPDLATRVREDRRLIALSQMCIVAQIACAQHSILLGLTDLQSEANALMQRMLEAVQAEDGAE